MACWCAALPVFQNVQVAAKLVRDFGRRQYADPARRQLNAQRNAIHSVANLHDGRQLLLGKTEGRFGAASTLFEELHGSRDQLDVGCGLVATVQSADGQRLLAWQAQTLARRRDNFHVLGRLQDFVDQGRTVQHMLEVVENEQQFLAAQVAEKLLFGRAPVARGHL